MTWDDLRENARRLEIDVAEYRTLVSMFLTSARADLESIDRSVAIGDFVTVDRSAHSLKGSSSMLDLWEIHEAVALVAERAKAADREGISEPLATVRREVDALAEGLRAADWTENAKSTEDSSR